MSSRARRAALRPIGTACLAAVVATVVGGCGRIGFETNALAANDAGDLAMDASVAADAASADAGPPGDSGETAVDAGLAAPDAGAADAGPPCSEAPCRLVSPQCGCAAGSACQRTGATTDVRMCVREGAALFMEECANDAACTAGHACLTVGTPTGVCQTYCYTDADCPGTSCGRLVEGTDVGVCGTTCVIGSGCPTGFVCKVILANDIDSAGPVAAAVCADSSGGGIGATCTSSLDCAGGLFCDDRCRALCPMGGPPCPPGEACVAVLAPITLGGVSYGVCR